MGSHLHRKKKQKPKRCKAARHWALLISVLASSDWCLSLLLHRSHCWDAWRDLQGYVTLHLGLLVLLQGGDLQHGRKLLDGPFTGEGWSDFLPCRADSHPEPGVVWPPRAEASQRGTPSPLSPEQGDKSLAWLAWERGGCWGQHLILFSGALPCPDCPLGDRRGNARLVTGSSWQSSVLQSLGFSHQLLRVVPGGSCYFYIKTHFLLIISVLHLENQI